MNSTAHRPLTAERSAQACNALVELEAACVEVLRERCGGAFDAHVYDAIAALRRARAVAEVEGGLR